LDKRDCPSHNKRKFNCGGGDLCDECTPKDFFKANGGKNESAEKKALHRSESFGEEGMDIGEEEMDIDES
jgi:hypothetical protein